MITKILDCLPSYVNACSTKIEGSGQSILFITGSAHIKDRVINKRVINKRVINKRVINKHVTTQNLDQRHERNPRLGQYP